MKTYLLFLGLLLGCSQMNAQSYTNSKGDKHLWGPCSLADLQRAPYQEWFAKNYDEHTSNLTKADAKKLEGVQVKIFIGTWCGDTKYLMPRFVKAWQQMGLATDDLEFIALHNQGDDYKQGPAGETEGYNIHRVPTFIFEKEGQEIGRIVERTVFDLDTDIQQIASGGPYHSRYHAVGLLHDFMNDVADDSLSTKNTLNTAYRMIRREVASSSELNTYGYALKAQQKLKQAEFVFKLNRYLFRYTPNVRDSYGEILFALGKLEEAKVEYFEVLRLKKEDENAVKMLAKIMQKEKELG